MGKFAFSKSSARAVIIGSVMVASVGLSMGTAGASPKSTTYNNADVKLQGGDAAAFAACINHASLAAKHHRTVQKNRCKNIATAVGGTVILDNVSIWVEQDGGKGKTHNDAKVVLSGGNATAVAACVNVLQGTASAKQENDCKNVATAKGGDVIVSDSDFTVIQG